MKQAWVRLHQGRSGHRSGSACHRTSPGWLRSMSAGTPARRSTRRRSLGDHARPTVFAPTLTSRSPRLSGACTRTCGRLGFMPSGSARRERAAAGMGIRVTRYGAGAENRTRALSLGSCGHREPVVDADLLERQVRHLCGLGGLHCDSPLFPARSGALVVQQWRGADQRWLSCLNGTRPASTHVNPCWAWRGSTPTASKGFGGCLDILRCGSTGWLSVEGSAAGPRAGSSAWARLPGRPVCRPQSVRSLMLVFSWSLRSPDRAPWAAVA